MKQHGHVVGGRWTREYRSYQCMKTRCYQRGSGSYERYGGAGVRMHDEWRESFVAFLRDVGLAPSAKHQLDRIDPTRGYEPGNVRWVTAEENNRTRRNRHWVEWKGQRMLFTDACRIAGLDCKVVKARLATGWPVDDAFTLPNDGTSFSRDPIVRCLQRAARARGRRWSVISKRIKRGWSLERAYS